MDIPSLFPADGGIGGVLNAQPRPLVSFKAGILNRDETTNLVTADPRKGVFQLFTSPMDNLLHLTWQARNQSIPDHDLIIFNAETEMKKVTSCPDSARVYVLKWHDANQRLFFWMQEKNPSVDEGLIAQVNTILERGPESQQRPIQINRTQNATQPISTRMDVSAPQQLATERNAEATENTANTAIPANSTSQQPNPSNNSNAITLEQMRAALPSGRTASGNPPAADANAALRMVLEQAQREQILTTPTVSELLNPQSLNDILQDEKVQAALPSLLAYLPEQDRSVDRIRETLRSPPLRSQAAALSNALQSGQATELLRSFGLSSTQNSSAFGLLAFIEALEELEQRQSKPSDQ